MTDLFIIESKIIDLIMFDLMIVDSMSIDSLTIELMTWLIKKSIELLIELLIAFEKFAVDFNFILLIQIYGPYAINIDYDRLVV